MARAHPGQIGLKGALYEGLTCDVLPFVWAAGGSGDVLDDPGALSAFGFFVELAPYLHPQSQTFKEATIAEAMARGEIVLHLNWPFAMSLLCQPGACTRSDSFSSAASVGRMDGPRCSAAATSLSRAARPIVLRRCAWRVTSSATTLRSGWVGSWAGSPPGGTLPLPATVTCSPALLPCVTTSGHDPNVPTIHASSRAWQHAFRAVVFEHADPRRDPPCRGAAVQGEVRMTGDRRSLSLLPRVGLESLLAAPLLLYLALFVAYPTVYAVKLAATDTLTQTFPSLANFRLLWDDRLFWRAVLGNLVLPLLSVAVELVLGLALALLLASRFPGRRYLRAVVVIPFALPEIVFLTAMRYAFAPRGYVNAALVLGGVQPMEWLLRPGT